MDSPHLVDIRQLVLKKDLKLELEHLNIVIVREIQDGFTVRDSPRLKDLKGGFRHTEDVHLEMCFAARYDKDTPAKHAPVTDPMVGLSETHIQLVMDHTKQSREQASEALRKHNGDVIHVIMALNNIHKN